MADPVVHITNGVPDSGTGNITTLGQTLLDGADIAIGATTDAAVTAGATGSVSAKLRSISRDLVANVGITNRSALYTAGASNSGLTVSAVTLMSTELNALANAAVIISSVGGGKFTNNDTGQAKYGELFFFLGTVTSMTAGGCFSGWFLTSPDSGTTYESTSVVPPRSPDFIIPIDATTGNKTYKSVGLVRLPALQFKVMIQNNTGQTTTATLNTLKLAPFSEVL